jgi:hypothetical protein
MNRDRALEILRGLQEPLAARGIAHAAVFGSIARRDGHERSDIDVFVIPDEGARLSLFDLGGIHDILEDAFGNNVDLVISPVRNTGLRAAIGRDRADAF